MIAQPVDLIIAGAQKAGTTSLFEYLKQHPAIRSHEQREMTFFFNEHEYNRGYEEAFGRYFGSKVYGNQTVVAKHVMAMYSPAALERISRHNPQARLILLLREPIKRAYSAYWYALRRGWEGIDGFEAALAAEPARIERDGWRHWRACAYVYNGQYDVHLRRIHKLFDPDLVRVYTTEDLKRDPGGLAQDIYRWIGIDDGFSPEVTDMHNTSAATRSKLLANLFARALTSRNPVKLTLRNMIPNEVSYRLRHAMLQLNEKPFSPPPMDQRILDLLVERFRANNTELAGLLGRELDVWNIR